MIVVWMAERKTMKKLDKQREHFNKIAEEYFLTRRGKKQKFLRYLICKELFRDIYINEGKIKVLEPMCGFGAGKEILQWFFKNEMDYEGFDYSEEMVKYAKALDPEINIYVQDVTTFKSDNKYDVIILTGGLHHVPDYAGEVLDNCCSLLAENGILINVEPTYNNFIFERMCKFTYKHNPVFDEKTERRFSLNELNKLYRRSKLEIVRQIYPGLLAYLIWGNPDAFPILNRGNLSTVKKIFNIDRHLMYTKLGKKCSVATFTVLKKKKI